MLELENIHKVYIVGEQKVNALNGVSLKFRKNEFVSVLGPSGCGKTTMLNIVGGLDHASKGDLKINGKSTKEFKDRNWDTYRNHSVGFVFQNYYLIPHQTVLENVELALTISGVSKGVRRKRAIEALERVGLKDKLKNRPNQLSGGQMQRVAIARALINDPEIVLADEPTGALDTSTSKQIMALLEEIAKDRLVIMVTHNPELADEYSTRIIRLLDGKVVDDTNPFDGEVADTSAEANYASEKADVSAASDESAVNAESAAKDSTLDEITIIKQKKRKTRMSFLTALSLSFKNLLTKKGRTLMVSFAGSIGIIGIALILAMSNGFQRYIDNVQRDTLSTYPVTITRESMDISGLMQMFRENGAGNNGSTHDKDQVYSNEIMAEMIKSFMANSYTNNLKDFKTHLEASQNELSNYVSAIQYGYDLDLNIYTNDTANINQINPSSLLEEILKRIPEASQYAAFASMMVSDMWSEMLGNQALLESQYEKVAGEWPRNYNEVVMVVDKNNEIADYNLYALGLKSKDELDELIEKIRKNEEIDFSQDAYSYEEMLSVTYRLVLPTDYYAQDNKGDWIDIRNDKAKMGAVLTNSLEVKVVGILRPSPNASATSIGGTIGYLSSLTEYYINEINKAQIVKEQKDNPDIDVFTGMPFVSADVTIEDVYAYVDSLEEPMKSMITAMLLNSGMSDEEIIVVFKENFMASATYGGNLKTLGSVDINTPATIYIYPVDFESKEKLTDFIDDYNNKMTREGKEQNVIKFSDIMGLMMSSISTIINAITYVLIGFVSVSLVVSSIMIGIITYISVLERIKEIGLLRSIGSSKGNISTIFIAETLLIGLVAGVFGIAVTLLLTIPVNLVIGFFTNISNLAMLPVAGAFILIGISMLLSVFAGFIPSRVAARKDPVEALRTE